MVRIQPSVHLVIPGGGKVTLAQLQSFIDQAKELGVPLDKGLQTKLEAPFHYDQRDSSPGSLTIRADG